MSKENPIHHQDQALIERIHAQHLERIGALGDEAIQFQDASYAVGRQRGAMEANDAMRQALIDVTNCLRDALTGGEVSAAKAGAALIAASKFTDSPQPLNPA